MLQACDKHAVSLPVNLVLLYQTEGQELKKKKKTEKGGGGKKKLPSSRTSSVLPEDMQTGNNN